MQQEISLLTPYKDAIQFAQELLSLPVYNVQDITKNIHERTIRRRIKKLEELGLAKYSRGKFTIKRVVSQPIFVLEQLIPSFTAFVRARRFGKFYRQTDINFMLKNLPQNSIITLDYSAFELTQFQLAREFFVYVDDVEKTAKFLKKNNFREGTRGNVVLLPKTGSFTNKIERIFLDCIAKGGRSTMDAIAIQLKYKNKITIPARFTTEMILKVQEDLSP